MSFVWLKRYMPRGLYGRAALILILPVVALQLVVSVVFIQRHFSGVSEQMSREVARAMNVALAGPDDLAAALDFTVIPVDPGDIPASDTRQWYDLSGVVVTRVLRQRIDDLVRVQLPNDRTVHLWLTRDGQSVQVSFDRRRASAANPHQLLVLMAIFGALMTLIAYVYLRNQLRPITQLAKVAEAFGRGRTLRYSPAGAIEVRAAGHAFVDMRNRIERQIEQRTMMLSGVSHDMRTPLTRMRLELSMLDPQDAAPLLRDLDDMQRLLDAFLDFARGEAEAGQAEAVDPMALVSDLVEKARRNGHNVTLGEIAATGQVPLRPLLVERAVMNLIENAVRYGTRCTVSVHLGDRALRIRVDDDGPGIPVADREAALKPFVRLDPARNQNKGSGVGLGLAITADIARAHGGTLRLGVAEPLGGLRADLVLAR